MAEEFDFQSFGDRLPPQNIEAEESILGGILLDPEAIARVCDILTPEAFYISAHKQIYEAALALYSHGSPTDLMTLAAWLGDRNLLEKVGGRSKLVQLVDRTVSAVNIDQYATLTIDKFLRRKLIQTGHEVANMGYDTATPLASILDRAEQKIFQLTQVRPQLGLVSIADTLIDTFQDLETRNEEQAMPGLLTEFYDLDALTSGFQRSDLIIVAGRPSMGKTAFCLNIARNIAARYRFPVALFSLEMSKEQLVQRLLSTEAGVDSNRLRSGRISQTEWEPLTQAIASLSELPIFIDDSANLNATEIRSKSRRLQAEQVKPLGLIVIDYLQLLQGTGTDNRTQELSQITRALKGLARELKVPVIALSQLSRGVESRNNKRPMMSDLRESGAIEQDSDLILMLYRDEYYNPDTPDAGIAEVLITKHRNGPTGVVKLLFNPQFTQFRNMARS